MKLTQRDITRFTAGVTQTEGCWLWNRSLDGKGYGQLMIDGKIRRAHRVAYYLAHGDIPEGMVILHTCDTPRCCNPAHLKLGTQIENLVDMRQKGRHAHGETNGSAILTAALVAQIRSEYVPGSRWHPGASHEYLAGKYGVDRKTISDLLARKTWAHI